MYVDKKGEGGTLLYSKVLEAKIVLNFMKILLLFLSIAPIPLL